MDTVRAQMGVQACDVRARLDQAFSAYAAGAKKSTSSWLTRSASS
jgi:hypothetical protein